MLLDFIWDLNPVVFTLGVFQLRWLTLFVVLGVLLGRFLLFRNLKNEGLSRTDGNTLFNYSLLGAGVGSRLFYFALFQPQVFASNPLHIVFPFVFKGGFRFEGESEFSLIGGLIGLFISVLLFSKLKKTAWPIALKSGLIIFLMSAVFISLGNFLQSENYGTPTDSRLGVQFVNRIEKKVMRTPCCIMRIPNGKNPLDSVVIKSGKVLAHEGKGYQPLLLYLFFTHGATEMLVNEFLIGDVKATLYELQELVYEPGDEPLHFTIFEEGINKYTARVQSIGIARHPVQLYEGFGMFLVSLSFLYLTRDKKENMNSLVPYFMVATISVIHFSVAFLANDRGVVIDWLSLSADQLVCIVVAAAAVLLAWRKGGHPVTI